MLKRYFEDADEEGYSRECCAKDTFATFVLRSNKAKKMYNEYIHKHDEIPMSKWYVQNFKFKNEPGS